MKQIQLILAVVLFAGSDAFFLNAFKSKLKPLPPVYPQPGYPPSSYGGGYQQQQYEPYKIPVWQAMPSGYMAQPYSAPQPQAPYYGGGQSSYSSGQSSYSGGYSAPDSTGYGALSYNAPQSSPQASSYDTGFQPSAGQYDSVSNTVGGGSSGDYTGGSPMISVPVYFPKDGNSQSGGLVPIPTSYSNGVSGFYDSSVAGSSVNVVGQAIPVPVPLSSSSSL